MGFACGVLVLVGLHKALKLRVTGSLTNFRPN